MPPSTAHPRELHRLYCDHAPWLLSWLRTRLGNAHDAADLMHDTYVRLISSGRYPRVHHPGESRAFLVQIAKALVIDMHRRRRLEQAYLAVLAQQPLQVHPCEETRATTLQTLVRLDAALDCLPHRTRTVFFLSRFEGLTYSAIAQRQKVSVGTVRKDMLRAAQACLQALLDDSCGGVLS